MLQTQATQSVRPEILQAFPKENQRQEEGAALESNQESGRARGNCVAFSQYTQLDIIGGGSVPGQVAHIVRFGFLQVARSRRGLPHACDLVLYHSWSMHTPHTGEECPFDNIEDLHWA